ncbi:MAG: glutathione S-transferase [Pikeienuella sp.]
MTYTLYIQDRAYSSWSLRGYLLLAAFDIPHRVRHEHWRSPEYAALQAEIAPSRTVPALRGDDFFLWDSLAMAETLSERHDGIWPTNPAARAAARSVTAEMHSGFGALRSECPMNLRRRWDGFRVSDAVKADVARMTDLWAWARGFSDGTGPYLFGAYSAADAFFAPAASRIDTYGIEVGAEDAAYIDALHRVPAFRRWRAMAYANDVLNPDYEFNLGTLNGWPGEAAMPARAIDSGTPVNDACPYSGDPVAADSLAEINGTVIGYCNQFCRDKSVADAGAWPATMAILVDR